MIKFRVFFNGGKTATVEAETPADASTMVRKDNPGAIITKIKRVKS